MEAPGFFATIKRELINDRAWPTRAGLHRAVFNYIESWDAAQSTWRDGQRRIAAWFLASPSSCGLLRHSAAMIAADAVGWLCSDAAGFGTAARTIEATGARQ